MSKERQCYPAVTGDKPVRVQLQRTKGWRMPPNTVKVDRSTPWGNIYSSGQYRYCSATDAVSAFAFRLKENMHQDARYINANIGLLRGKNLACWCKPGAPCHADILLEIANGK